METSDSTLSKPFSLRIFRKIISRKKNGAQLSKNIFIKKDESFFFRYVRQRVTAKVRGDYLLVGLVDRVDAREETRLPLFTR